MQIKPKRQAFAIIHQELKYVYPLKCGRKYFPGTGELLKNGRLDNERMNQETKEILHKLNIDIDPKAQVSELAVSRATDGRNRQGTFTECKSADHGRTYFPPYIQGN